jgi:hypothetical protein
MDRQAPGRKLMGKCISMSQAGFLLNKYHGMESFFLRGIAVKSRIREKSRSGAQLSALRILDKSNRRLASGMKWIVPLSLGPALCRGNGKWCREVNSCGGWGGCRSQV